MNLQPTILFATRLGSQALGRSLAGLFRSWRSFPKKLFCLLLMDSVARAGFAADLDPVLRGSATLLPSESPSDLAEKNGYAFIAAEAGGLIILDVSDPANPQRVGGYDTSGSALGLALSGNLAYIADGQAGLQIIDVSNPANPQRVGSYDTGGSAQAVALSANYAYVADLNGGLQVIDVSKPANPQWVGRNSAMSDAHGVAVTADYMFVAANDPALVVLHLFTPRPTLSFARGPRSGENGFRVAIEGLPGLSFQIERSADLLNWQIWTNGVFGTGPLEFLDATATLATNTIDDEPLRFGDTSAERSQRFYRARLYSPWDY